MEVFPSIYTGIGISGGYVTDDMVDVVNGTHNNDSIARLVNFVIPIQLGSFLFLMIILFFSITFPLTATFLLILEHHLMLVGRQVD